MRAYCDEPRLAADGTLDHAPGIAQSPDETVVRPASAPFEAQGGLRLLRGNLGSALIKLSAVKPEFRSITAPAVVVDARSEEHTSELQSLMRISYAVFCLNKKTSTITMTYTTRMSRRHKRVHKKNDD